MSLSANQFGVLQAMSDEEAEVATRGILENKRNTYLYTKAMAETVVEEERMDCRFHEGT